MVFLATWFFTNGDKLRRIGPVSTYLSITKWRQRNGENSLTLRKSYKNVEWQQIVLRIFSCHFTFRIFVIIWKWLLKQTAWGCNTHFHHFVGLNDKSQEGIYRWVDNSPTSYTDWTTYLRYGIPLNLCTFNVTLFNTRDKIFTGGCMLTFKSSSVAAHFFVRCNIYNSNYDHFFTHTVKIGTSENQMVVHWKTVQSSSSQTYIQPITGMMSRVRPWQLNNTYARKELWIKVR